MEAGNLLSSANLAPRCRYMLQIRICYLNEVLYASDCHITDFFLTNLLRGHREVSIQILLYGCNSKSVICDVLAFFGLTEECIFVVGPGSLEVDLIEKANDDIADEREISYR